MAVLSFARLDKKGVWQRMHSQHLFKAWFVQGQSDYCYGHHNPFGLPSVGIESCCALIKVLNVIHRSRNFEIDHDLQYLRLHVVCTYSKISSSLLMLSTLRRKRGLSGKDPQCTTRIVRSKTRSYRYRRLHVNIPVVVLTVWNLLYLDA